MSGQIQSGGRQVLSGGTASQVDVQSGGSQTLLPGAIASKTAVEIGGTLTNSGGTAVSATDGGQEIVTGSGISVSGLLVGSGPLLRPGGIVTPGPGFQSVVSGGATSIAVRSLDQLSGTVTSAGQNAILAVQNTSQSLVDIPAAIEGFALNDQVYLPFMAFANDSVSVDLDTVTISAASGAQYSLDIAGASSMQFQVNSIRTRAISRVIQGRSCRCWARTSGWATPAI